MACGPCCSLAFSGRSNLGKINTYLNVLLGLAGQGVLAAALYIKFNLEKRLALVLNNESGALAYFLMATGGLLVVVHFATAKICYELTTEEGCRRRTSRFLLFILTCQGIMLVFTIAGAILCGVHEKLVWDALHAGFIQAIQLYRDDQGVKTTMDYIQIEFGCCGSQSYVDWFKHSWVHMRYINAKHPAVVKYLVNGEFVKDDVPFSCCNIYIPRPCIHHDLQNPAAHAGIVEGSSTLYPLGCTEVLHVHWKNRVLRPVLAVMLVYMVFELLVMMLTRLLQTSLDEALDYGNPMGEGEAYICRSRANEDTTGGRNKRKRTAQDFENNAVADDDDDDDDGQDYGDDFGGAGKKLIGKVGGGMKKMKKKVKKGKEKMKNKFKKGKDKMKKKFKKGKDKMKKKVGKVGKKIKKMKKPKFKKKFKK